ncbi:hypothetical protein VSVS12_02725 [Vibrio scophthalmi]|uniref:hypothetical protein n=1 Tax=Vibrio scophthalmi TaxID=45658 RepID=UPI000809978D|nr:hypothetical protein [Vibrio scophthalmi]ANS86474.1 hypothetical protein VSVS12_02725 [Vibrio scophthalmi]
MESITIEECSKAVEIAYTNNAIVWIVLIISYFSRWLLKDVENEKLDYTKLNNKQIDNLINNHESKVKELKKIKSLKISNNTCGNT